MQCFRPVAFSQLLAGECSIRCPHPRPGTVLVLHRFDTAIEDGGGVLGGRRRNDPGCRRPDLGLVVFADRRHRIGCDAEEPRCEIARGAGVLAIDDGGRGCDAGRMADLGVARGPKAPDEARGLRSERARERMRFVEHQEVEAGVGEELDVLLPGEEQL